MKTLYLSDLDGTLLRSDETLSPYTSHTLNALVSKGMLFSYATARSVHTAKKVTHGLDAKIPLIVYNGTFIIDNVTLERIATHTFESDEAADIYYTLTHFGIYPIVYALIDSAEKFSYDTHTLSIPLEKFILSRKGDDRDNPLSNDEHILNGDAFYFTCIDSDEKLYPAYSALKDKYNCLYQSDVYSGSRFLEILPSGVSKAKAALQLKELYSCDEIVGFGDGLNDIPLLRAADRFYAVKNANEDVKALASGVISSNNSDGVAKFLLEDFKNYEI